MHEKISNDRFGFIPYSCLDTSTTISSNSLSTLGGFSLDNAYMRSIASRLSVLFLLLAWHSIRASLDTLPMLRSSVGCYFSAYEDGFGATDGGAVGTACLQIVVYFVTHGELSHSCLCPVDKGS